MCVCMYASRGAHEGMSISMWCVCTCDVHAVICHVQLSVPAALLPSSEHE